MIAVFLLRVVANQRIKLRKLFGDGLSRNARTKIFRRKLVDGAIRKFQIRDGNAPRFDLRANHQAFVVEDAAVVNQNVARLHVAKFAVDDLRAVARQNEIKFEAVVVLVH